MSAMLLRSNHDLAAAGLKPFLSKEVAERCLVWCGCGKELICPPPPSDVLRKRTDGDSFMEQQVAAALTARLARGL